MGAALTESSSLGCTHGGSISLHAGQSKLTVNGSKVLVSGDLDGASVSLCGTTPSPTTSPCQTFTPSPGGAAQKLKVNGKGVLLETLQGITNGVPPGGPAVVQSAGQTKLQTT